MSKKQTKLFNLKYISLLPFILMNNITSYAGWFDKSITIKSGGTSITEFSGQMIGFGVNILRVIGLFTFIFGFIKALNARGQDDPHGLMQGVKMGVAGLVLLSFGQIMVFITT